MWGFAIQPPRMVEAAPKHDEFFLSSVPDQAHALVRELTQNSADAARDDAGQVRLAFRFVEIDRELFHKRYLPGLPHSPTLAAHLMAAGMPQPLAIDDNGPVRLLVIEDFGTTGLTGAYDKYEEESSFQAFWKRYGTSNKGEDRGGRHGIGKSVVPSSSRIHAFYGLTKRRDDGREFFMGQIVLRPHRIGANTFDSFGQFSPTEGDDWALPYSDSGTIQRAKMDFQLERADEPGLSLVVPYVRPEIDEEGLTRAAVEHCFHQILTGHLEVTVGGRVLSQDTLLDVVDTLGNPSLRAAARLSAEAAAGELVKFKSLAPVRNRLTEASFDASALLSMRERFESGATVCVSVPVEIQAKGSKEKGVGHLTLYLKRADDPAGARETYVRGRVTVPSQQKQLGGSAMVGLLVAEDGPASRFLGDSEDVAHTKWVKNKLTEKYINPSAAFDVAKGALRELKRILVGEGEDQQIKDALKDLFWQPKPAHAATRAESKSTLDERNSNPPVFDVREVEGGFNAEIKDLAIGSTIEATLEVAYAVRRGKGRWSRDDFEFGKDIKITATGPGDVDWAGNRIQVRAAMNGLRIKAIGFDPNRDVIVRVRAVGEA